MRPGLYLAVRALPALDCPVHDTAGVSPATAEAGHTAPPPKAPGIPPANPPEHVPEIRAHQGFLTDPLCASLRAALLSAFPSSHAYLNALCGDRSCPSCRESATSAPGTPCTTAPWRISYPRLAALSLLPALIEAAGGTPADYTLHRDGHGRPYAVLPDGIVAFDFNLTHTDDHVACALLVPAASVGMICADGHDQPDSRPPHTPRAPFVGLDIEEPIPPPRATRMAARFCTEGEHRLLAAAEAPATVPESRRHPFAVPPVAPPKAPPTAFVRPPDTPPNPAAETFGRTNEITNYRQNSPNHRDPSPWRNRGATVAQPCAQPLPLWATGDFLPPISDFTRIWTIREALAKQDGRGGPLGFDAALPPPAVSLLSVRLADTGASLTLCVPTAYASDLADLRLL